MFSPNSLKSVTKKFKIKRKIAGLEPRISCVRDRDSTTQPQSHRQQSRSLYGTQFMPQWFLRFSEFTESSGPFRENSIVRYHSTLLCYKTSKHVIMHTETQKNEGGNKFLPFPIQSDFVFPKVQDRSTACKETKWYCWNTCGIFWKSYCSSVNP